MLIFVQFYEEIKFYQVSQNDCLFILSLIFIFLNKEQMEQLRQWTHRQKHFFKMHGTGNDFIIISGMEQNGGVLGLQKAKALAQKLCHRKFGIGADGLLIITQVKGVYKMQVINSDSSCPSMCGNGLRCFVSLLYNQKMITDSYRVLTDDGSKDINVQALSACHQSSAGKYVVTLKMGRGGLIYEFKEQKYKQFYLTTIGVPHVVIFLTEQEFQQVNSQSEGKEIQNKFDANINFCRISAEEQIHIKTFQRGAGMTYSCGTGVSSSVYVAVSKQMIHSRRVKTITDGGQIEIQVNQQNDVIMKGPAQIICQGQYYD